MRSLKRRRERHTANHLWQLLIELGLSTMVRAAMMSAYLTGLTVGNAASAAENDTPLVTILEANKKVEITAPLSSDGRLERRFRLQRASRTLANAVPASPSRVGGSS